MGDRTVGRRTYLLSLGAFLLVFAMLLLIGPRVPDEEQEESCVVNIDLPGIWGISLNCDSPEFMRLAADPALLLEPKNVRQARPGLILAAYLVSLPLAPLNGLARRLQPEVGRQAPERIDRPLSDYFAVFAAYALLNAGLMVLAWLLLFSVWDTERTRRVPLLLLPIAVFTIANQVFRQSFWSPHTGIFYILVPIFCLWVAAEALQRGLLFRPLVFLLSLLAGFGLTAYATLVLYIPCLLLPSLLRRGKQPGLAWRAVVNVLLVLLPLLGWMLFVRAKTGGFYNHEAEAYGQLVWIFRQDLARTVVHLLRNLLLVLAGFIKGNYAVVAAAVLAVLLSWRSLGTDQRQRLMLAASLSVLIGVFFAFIGYFPERIIFMMVPPLFAALGIGFGSLAPLRGSPLSTAVACLLVAGWSAYLLAVI